MLLCAELGFSRAGVPAATTGFLFCVMFYFHLYVDIHKEGREGGKEGRNIKHREQI